MTPSSSSENGPGGGRGGPITESLGLGLGGLELRRESSQALEEEEKEGRSSLVLLLLLVAAAVVERRVAL